MRKENSGKFPKSPKTSLNYPPRILSRVPQSSIISNQHIPHHSSSKFINQKSEMKAYANNQDVSQTCFEWFWKKSKKDILKNSLERGSTRPDSMLKRKKGGENHKLMTRNSPYVKNYQEYQRIMSLLKPIKGPTDSFLQQIKRHNNNNLKNAENVLLASNNSFNDKRQKFCLRIGLKNHQKIFIMNSKDKHIRQMLLSQGWFENTDFTSPFFHLKWAYNDSPLDYQNLQQSQHFNHFKNNQELTNKNLLQKNIIKREASQRPNHPLTFDLQVTQDSFMFQQQFIRYSCYGQIARIWQILKEIEKQKEKKVFVSMGLLNMSEKEFYQAKKSRDDLFIGKNQGLDEEQKIELFSIRQLIYSLIGGLINLKKSNCSQNNKQVGLNGNKLSKILKILNQKMTKVGQPAYIYQKIFQADQLLISFIFSIKNYVDCTAGDSFGYENWWIVKPTGVSRGSGIRIEKEMGKIISSKHGKIVQKYLEKPLLLKCKRKFDIRQWVLVKSFEPLHAYFFDNCYARFSLSKYSTKNQSLKVHLTNYSQHKMEYTQKNRNGESVLSQKDLENEIDEQTWKGKWRSIKKDIKVEILKTLKCCRNQIQDQNGCFEVFGFDVILDSSYKPWILEVNMSPACQERTVFLRDYLTKMAEGIIDLVEKREIRNWQRIDETSLMKGQKNKEKLIVLQSVIKIQRFVRKLIKNKKEFADF